nr:hypothetical protein [Morchella crassipes]
MLPPLVFSAFSSLTPPGSLPGPYKLKKPTKYAHPSGPKQLGHGFGSEGCAYACKAPYSSTPAVSLVGALHATTSYPNEPPPLRPFSYPWQGPPPPTLIRLPPPHQPAAHAARRPPPLSSLAGGAAEQVLSYIYVYIYNKT